jgi:uncharacterized protein (DUF362 family)/Pyruvate/2-oxoacid:ferredoxin oxidoreductase delta subunit
MENISKVVVVQCDSYEIESVRTAVKRGLNLLGGAGQFAASGEKILIKPNLLVGDPPEKCVSPHPSVFQAVLEELKATGANLSYGDSPAVGSLALAARYSGLLAPAEHLGVPMADFQTSVTVPFPDGNLIKQFTLVKDVVETDGLISLCKLKSHALTRITGAVKNQFGCVPGVLKTEFHASLPNPQVFSRMLVDLNRLIKPRLFIMDGIMAMEGNGPRNGTPRKMRVILMSTDPVALDATVCRLVNLDEKMVDTIVFGEQFGLGTAKVELLGDPIESFITPDFNVNRQPAGLNTNRNVFLSTLIRRYVSQRPVIDPAKCTHCGKCEEICPAQPKALSWADGRKQPPVYDYSLCIRCFCCQEICPHEAISVKTPMIRRILRG